ncbi:nectin-4-like isoform X2 [Scleropages formosus]|uniref:nectin-4-like isoform X2 n=1 Tax=Scleropages formosus TaxID=113540 RepID=UPI0010FAAE9E|nr:nectin-4-like isoform X2 [Scleropages formosus]
MDPWKEAPEKSSCGATWLTLLLCAFVPRLWAEFLEPPPSLSLHSLAETQTRLPCVFVVQEGQVVQVTWTREQLDGTRDQVITAHGTEGRTEFGRFSGRVRFEDSNPLGNATLVILSTMVSDEGTYTCHISAFPSGNFERQISLTVWTKPISAVDPVELVEGQSLRVAATCRSLAHPLPGLSWDTNLTGRSQNRSPSGGATSITFSVEPVRSMNGKQLDCLVWHPSLQQPHRILNRLVVHYPPEATITGYDEHWFVGLEHASLTCKSNGNPTPQNFTWNRDNGILPDGVHAQGNVLHFSRPLLDTDAGIYECTARNSVGMAKDSLVIKLAKTSRSASVLQSPVTIILCGTAGALLMITVVSVAVVTCYYRHKKKKLETELNEKTEEIVSLSRQNSVRRLNSINSDPRIQDFCRRTDSYSSQTGWRRSRAGECYNATLQPTPSNSLWQREMERTSDVEMDREQNQSRQRAESLRNLKTSPVETCASGLCKLQDMESRDQSSLRTSVTEVRGLQGLESKSWPSPSRNSVSEGERSQPLDSQALGSPGKTKEDRQEHRWEDAEGEEEDSKTSISEISQAISTYFHCSNGIFQPKRHSNAILIDPRGQII